MRRVNIDFGWVFAYEVNWCNILAIRSVPSMARLLSCQLHTLRSLWGGCPSVVETFWFHHDAPGFFQDAVVDGARRGKTGCLA
jgi:hypothetical protein